jgi:hypothetical protein
LKADWPTKAQTPIESTVFLPPPLENIQHTFTSAANIVAVYFVSMLPLPPLPLYRLGSPCQAWILICADVAPLAAKHGHESCRTAFIMDALLLHQRLLFAFFRQKRNPDLRIFRE